MIDKTVCVIGCGLIGRHHVNSCIESGFSVIAVDHSVEALKFSCQTATDLDQVSLNECDIFIVSTTSQHRFEIVEKIESNCTDAIVILEKPLFVKKNEFNQFDEILSNKKNKYFINLPNYWLASWKQLASVINFSDISQIKIDGYDWGMACNVLHDISILMNMFNITDSECIKISKFSGQKVSESKRNGFLEIYGSLALFANEVDVNIICSPGSGEPVKKMKFYKDDSGLVAAINLFSGDVESNNLIPDANTLSFFPPRASDSTGKIVKSIVDGYSVLPRVEQISHINERVYNEFSDFCNLRVMNEYDYPFS